MAIYLKHHQSWIMVQWSMKKQNTIIFVHENEFVNMLKNIAPEYN